MGIYVKDSTSLTVNEGNLNIQSEDAINVGGIYIIGQKIFNKGNFDFNFSSTATDENEEPCHFIESEDQIIIKKGLYSINSVKGKGIHSKSIICRRRKWCWWKFRNWYLFRKWRNWSKSNRDKFYYY